MLLPIVESLAQLLWLSGAGMSGDRRAGRQERRDAGKERSTAVTLVELAGGGGRQWQWQEGLGRGQWHAAGRAWF